MQICWNKWRNYVDRFIGERKKGLNELYAHQVVCRAKMTVNDRTQMLAKYSELLPPDRH